LNELGFISAPVPGGDDVGLDGVVRCIRRDASRHASFKQWINVLGLSTDPTVTDSVMLGSHQATRQRWKNGCGYVVLEAHTSKGGDHGPPDALFAHIFLGGGHLADPNNLMATMGQGTLLTQSQCEEAANNAAGRF
jgi:hypothetical protein